MRSAKQGAIAESKLQNNIKKFKNNLLQIVPKLWAGYYLLQTEDAEQFPFPFIKTKLILKTDHLDVNTFL